MDGFSHLHYRCIACQYYTKLGIRVASNAYGAPYAKTLISAKVEMRVFCLLRLCPNPRRTQFCVLETLEKSSSYAILQIAKWASTPVLFRFSRHGERKVSCRCQQDCHKHQPRLPPHQQHRAFLRCRCCRTESAAVGDLGTAESTAEKRIVIRERSTDMPRMSKSKKLEWSFFLNDRGRKAYNTLCRRCVHDCKQSFRAVVVICPHYQSKRSNAGRTASLPRGSTDKPP